MCPIGQRLSNRNTSFKGNTNVIPGCSAEERQASLLVWKNITFLLSFSHHINYCHWRLAFIFFSQDILAFQLRKIEKEMWAWSSQNLICMPESKGQWQSAVDQGEEIIIFRLFLRKSYRGPLQITCKETSLFLCSKKDKQNIYFFLLAVNCVCHCLCYHLCGCEPPPEVGGRE